MKELTHASVAELSALLSKKEVSAKEIAQAYLDKIEDKKSLNAFLDVRPEVTLKEAEAADRKIAEGTASPLTGVPIAHKDIFVTRNWASTAASKMLENYMSPFVLPRLNVFRKPASSASAKPIATNSQWAQLRPTAPMERHSIPGTNMSFQAALPAVPLPALPRDSHRQRPLPTRADRSVSLQPSAASPVLSPRTAVPAAGA